MRKKLIIPIVFLYLFLSPPLYAQKEGYCQFFELKGFDVSDFNELAFLDTPANKRLVVRQIYHRNSVGSLCVNGKLFFHYEIFNQFLLHEFPDGCVVIPEDATLSMVRHTTQSPFDREPQLCIIGYYETAVEMSSCAEELVCDLNGDCKVDLKDLALFSNEWMKTSEAKS